MDSHHETPTEPITRGSRSPIGSTNAPVQPKPMRMHRGNPLIPFLLFLLGIMLGVLVTLFFILFVARDRTPIQTTSSTQLSSVTVQVSSGYLTQLVSQKLKTSGIGGNISNVQVILTNNNQIQIRGEDRLNLVVVGITRPFTLTLQSYTQSCQPKVHLIHADFGDIPVTNFVQNYEDQINQDIQVQSSALPSGFTYCATSTHTQANALNIVYSATPS